jgi:hypothetical protein
MPFVKTSFAKRTRSSEPRNFGVAPSTSASSAAPLAPLRLPPLPFWSASVSSCACTARRCLFWFENSTAVSRPFVATFAHLLPQPSMHCT